MRAESNLEMTDQVIDAADRFGRRRDRANNQRAAELLVALECSLRGWDRDGLDRNQAREIVRYVRRADSQRHRQCNDSSNVAIAKYCMDHGLKYEDLDQEHMDAIWRMPGYTIRDWRPSVLPDDLDEVEIKMNMEPPA